MQRPRRTSEFHEEPGTANKRRGQRRRSHSSSLDRASYVPTPLPLRAPAVVTVRGTTPQRSTATPSSSRKTVTSVALHNDKKWVQDRCTIITDHLQMAFEGGALNGPFDSAFFTRSGGGLRQMTIKQFVCIVNYFLQFVWGNRFVVSSTAHADDIVKFLQKLNYPYQVNKSWLKTPNTQHSFGNVIVLLDFLMDFVSPTSDEDPQKNDLHFDFQDAVDFDPNVTAANNLLVVQDLEYHVQMLRHSEEGFRLWDRQLMNDFTALQRQTCDALVYKCCGLDGLDALDIELRKLQEELAKLKSERPHISRKEKELHHQLSEELRYNMQNIEILNDDLAYNKQRLAELRAMRDTGVKEVDRLQEKVAQMKAQIDKQIFTSKQREEIIDAMAQLKHVLQSASRTVLELKDRNHQQEVLLSRTKKQLNNGVEKFNGRMREAIFSKLFLNSNLDIQDLQLPLNPKEEDIKQLLPLLNALKQVAEQLMLENIKQEQQLQKEATALANEINVELEPKINDVNAAIMALETSTQQFQSQSDAKRAELNEEVQQMQEQIVIQETDNQQLKESNAEKEQQLLLLRQENENTMASAEQEYGALADAREQTLNRYATTLEQANHNLQRVVEIANKNEAQMQLLKTESKNPTEDHSIS